MIRRFLNKQFVKFILLGGFAAAVNFFSRIVFGFYVNYSSSIILGQLLGMCVAYVLFKYFVFAAGSNSSKQSIGYFLLINVIGMGMILGVSLFCYDVLFAQWSRGEEMESLSHFFGLAATTVVSYFGHKYLTFK